MSESKIAVTALIQKGDPVGAAIRRGTFRAIRQHIQAGVPMVAWRDGKTVDIPPEELMEILKKSGERIEPVHSLMKGNP